MSENLHPVFKKIIGRWDIQTQRWVDDGPVQPFTDTDSIRAAGGDPGATPVEECVHSWFRVSGADRFKCTHCGTVRILE